MHIICVISSLAPLSSWKSSERAIDSIEDSCKSMAFIEVPLKDDLERSEEENMQPVHFISSNAESVNDDCSILSRLAEADEKEE